MTYKEIIKLLDDHAKAHYEEGFDGWLETLDYEDKRDIVHSTPLTFDACYGKFIQWVAGYAEGDAIRAENCALYEESPEYAQRIQDNYEARRDEAFAYCQKDLAKELPYEKVKIEF